MIQTTAYPDGPLMLQSQKWVWGKDEDVRSEDRIGLCQNDKWKILTHKPVNPCCWCFDVRRGESEHLVTRTKSSARVFLGRMQGISKLAVTSRINLTYGPWPEDGTTIVKPFLWRAIVRCEQQTVAWTGHVFSEPYKTGGRASAPTAAVRDRLDDFSCLEVFFPWG